MSLTPQEILDRIAAILPGFLAYWESPEGSRSDDGSFSRCGVFTDCSDFVRDRYEDLSPLQRRQLADFALECMSQTDRDLADAAATCFLENLTFERFSKDFESYLSGQARDFYRRFQGHRQIDERQKDRRFVDSAPEGHPRDTRHRHMRLPQRQPDPHRRRR